MGVAKPYVLRDCIPPQKSTGSCGYGLCGAPQSSCIWKPSYLNEMTNFGRNLTIRLAFRHKLAGIRFQADD